ncbi:hypothetical protein AVEN_59863-1 [Araneus ventricosus]|uniref:Uncharacterized protein n=1 Tax=Araneus ventricosus TaxID=182803 RepID=A0A4Y2FE15_ARAVE|nr:hypothetical protein AVEN_59863-1 [Araneus ventricosus]
MFTGNALSRDGREYSGMQKAGRSANMLKCSLEMLSPEMGVQRHAKGWSLSYHVEVITGNALSRDGSTAACKRLVASFTNVLSAM